MQSPGRRGKYKRKMASKHVQNHVLDLGKISEALIIAIISEAWKMNIDELSTLSIGMSSESVSWSKKIGSSMDDFIFFSRHQIP